MWQCWSGEGNIWKNNALCLYYERFENSKISAVGQVMLYQTVAPTACAQIYNHDYLPIGGHYYYK